MDTVIDGHIHLARKILESNLCPKGKFSRFEAWIYLLLKANGLPKRWQGIDIERGSFITSQVKLSLEWGWSLGNTNKFLKWLKSESRIETKPTNKFTLIKILKYNKYNSFNESKSETKVKAKENQSESKVKQHNKDNKDNKDNNIHVEIQRIYDFYVSSFNKNSNTYKLTPLRKKKISMRLKDAGIDLLLKAIKNTSKSAFHRGDNDRGWEADLDFIIRSYEQVERFANQRQGKLKSSDGTIFDNETDLENYENYKKGENESKIK